MKPNRAILLTLLLAVPGVVGAAEFPTLSNDGWYRVEVVIFERLDAPAATQEILVSHAPRVFPRDVLAFDDEANRTAAYVLDADALGPADSVSAAAAPRAPSDQAQPLTPADRAAAAIAQYEAQLKQRSYRFEPQANLQLSAQAGRLQRAGGYRVVFHRAWIQPVPDRDELVPLLIQAGDRIADAWRIEGTLGVTRGRYLHLDARLWYAPDPTPPPAPAMVAVVSDETEAGAGTDAGPEYMQLYEQRRMRSGELHYLDHPRFGVLARVDPVLPPDALVAELARLGAAPATTTVPPASQR